MTETADITPGPGQPREAQRLELLVSSLMRTGVVLSLLMIVGGALLTLTRQTDYELSREAMARLTEHANGSVQRQNATWESLFSGRGRGLTVAGLVLLIFTPVARVVTCAAALIAQRDWRFVALTVVVLVVLLSSFLLGKVR